MKASCIIHIKEGVVQNPAAVWKCYASMKDGYWNGVYTKRNKRSLQQNAYLHHILIPEFRKALNDVGYDEVRTDAQAKLIMKKMFLTVSIPNKETAEALEYVRDTSDLNKDEMSILFDDVIKFAWDNMNYKIPYPNEQTKIDYYLTNAD